MFDVVLLVGIEIPSSWQIVTEQVRMVEGLIDGLRLDWRIVLVMTVVVIAAGALSSVLQITRHEKSKLIVAACGAMSASITAVVSLVYPLSAKEMSDRITRADGEIRRAFRYMGMNELPASNEKVAHMQKLHQYLENAETIIVDGGRLASEPEEIASILVRPAFAQTKSFSTFPRNSAYLYFVGTSVGESLEGARADAIRLAQQEVQRAVLDQLPPSADSSSVAEVLGNTGSVADTDFSCIEDNGRKTCEYSVLYTVKRQTADFYLSSSGANRSQALEAMQKQEAYYQQRWHAYAGALDLAREKLAKEQYDTLLAGRLARRDKDYAESVKLLSAAVQKGDPAWYLGWLNLGLAYWTLGKTTEAREAFSNAAELEPSLPIRDASVYNTFGQFLVEQKNYSEAKSMLNRALEINPAITGAKYAIKVADRAPATTPTAEMQGALVP